MLQFKRLTLLGLFAVVAVGLFGTGCPKKIIAGRQNIVIVLKTGLSVTWTKDRFAVATGTSAMSSEEVETALADLRGQMERSGFTGPKPMFPEDLGDAEASLFLVLDPPVKTTDAEVATVLGGLRKNPLVKSADEQDIPQLAD